MMRLAACRPGETTNKTKNDGICRPSWEGYRAAHDNSGVLARSFTPLSMRGETAENNSLNMQAG